MQPPFGARCPPPPPLRIVGLCCSAGAGGGRRSQPRGLRPGGTGSEGMGGRGSPRAIPLDLPQRPRAVEGNGVTARGPLVWPGAVLGGSDPGG